MSEASYIEGEPVVGWTLEVDGDPRVVERLMKAVFEEYNRIVREMPFEAVLGGPLPVQVGFSPELVPVRMRIQCYTEHRDLSL